MDGFMSNLANGLSTTLVGMIIVFFGLLVLILCITVMHAVMNRGRKPVEVPPEEKVVVTKPEPEPEEEAEEEDEALIAVIAAAVAAVWEDPQSGFVVRRVRRVSNSPLSARLARDEQMYSHF